MSPKDIKPVGLGIALPIQDGKMDWTDPSSGYNFIQGDFLEVSNTIAPDAIGRGALDITAIPTENDLTVKLFDEFCHDDMYESAIDSASHNSVNSTSNPTFGSPSLAPIDSAPHSANVTPRSVLAQHGLMGAPAVPEQQQSNVHIQQQYQTQVHTEDHQPQQEQAQTPSLAHPQRQPHFQNLQSQLDHEQQTQHQSDAEHQTHHQQTHHQQTHHQQQLQVELENQTTNEPPVGHYAQQLYSADHQLQLQAHPSGHAAVQSQLQVRPQTSLFPNHDHAEFVQSRSRAQLQDSQLVHLQRPGQTQFHHHPTAQSHIQTQNHLNHGDPPQTMSGQIHFDRQTQLKLEFEPHPHPPVQSHSGVGMQSHAETFQNGAAQPQPSALQTGSAQPSQAQNQHPSAVSAQSTPETVPSPCLNSPPVHANDTSPGTVSAGKQSTTPQFPAQYSQSLDQSSSESQLQRQQLVVQNSSLIYNQQLLNSPFQVPQQAQFQPQLGEPSQELTMAQFPAQQVMSPVTRTLQFHVGAAPSNATLSNQPSPNQFQMIVAPAAPIGFSSRPWRTDPFQRWYSARIQMPLEPETAEDVNICNRLERAVAKVKICEDLQYSTVRAWDINQPLTLGQYDAMNKCEGEIVELSHHRLDEREQREKDDEKLALECSRNELLALHLRNQLMQFKLMFHGHPHFHALRVCNETCLTRYPAYPPPANAVVGVAGTNASTDNMKLSPPTLLEPLSPQELRRLEQLEEENENDYSNFPWAHRLVSLTQLERWKQRTHIVGELFYSSRPIHARQIRNIVRFLEDDFMHIKVTSLRAREVLREHFKNPYVTLFDHLQRQRVPEQRNPHIYQYVESIMDNVYLSAYYRVEAKKGTRKLDGPGGEYIPDEKDIGERYCGICDKWFKTRNHNWASHMTSTHGVCSATKSIYPFPLAVILGIPSTTQKEDGLVVHQNIIFETNSDGDLQIQNESQPRHHLLPDKDIKLSGLCPICCHYVPLYCKRGATVWTTWFRHQDKHIREFNQERNGGVAVNHNNPRNNKTRKEQICKERMQAWRQQQEERMSKRLKNDDMAFLEEGVVVDNVQNGSWLNEEFAMTQAEVTLTYQMGYQESEPGIGSGIQEFF
jgi:hypothetical protein